MKMENNIPKDVLESVNSALDNRIKYSIKRLVRMDTKQDRIESKVVAFSSNRLFILTAKSPSKVEQSVHFFSIRGIESKKPNQLVLSLDDEGKSNESKNMYFRTMEADTDEVNTMVSHIAVSLKQVFPGVAIERLIKTIDVQPASRLDGMNATLKELENKEVGPCGGFSQMYNFMCDYHNLMQREEVTWDVDTIYLSNGTKELQLADFDHLENKDLTPIISSLRHNPWFTVINSSGTKLITDNMNELIKVMKKNKVIEELHLAGVGVRFEFANRLSTALLSNSGSPLHTLDLSGNQIEDRGVIHLASPLGKLSKGIVHLSLSRCNLTPKGINRLAESLGSNKFTSSTLTTLNLSGNSLKGEEITSICNFLAQPNAIVNLDLSDTECALDILCGALIRGCTQSLTNLNLSGNVFTNKKMKDVNVPPTWKQFFTAAMSLQKVNLSNCRLPAEALKALINGIGNNRSIQDLELDISSNDFRSAGATVIQGNIAEINNISSLNISDNGFDVDLIGICSWMSRNKSIKELSIGKNFSNIRARHVSQVLESVVQMIQEEDSPIQSLSLAGSKLKGDIALLINALGSNSTLTKIDISGNNMGDYGARMLAKALQINTKLQTIYWDQNNTSAQGFHDIANALKHNFTLKYMPTPVCDASKSNSERAQASLEKIESLLHRNHSPRKFNSDKSFRLQHGFLISSTQQMVDRLVLQIQDAINTLSDDTNTATSAKVEHAKLIIRDAENSKHLLLKLQEVALQSEEKGSTLDNTLSTMTDDLKKVLEDQLDRNLKDMLTSAEEQCPTVIEADGEAKEEIKAACEEKSALPKNYVKGLIVHQAGTDMFNKMSEINLSVAAYMSDRIIDTVLEQLTSCHRNLVDCLNSMISSKQDVKVTVDKPDNDADIITIEKDAEMHNDGDSSSKYTEKRKSYHSRRVRPQSFVDPQFGDTDLDLHTIEKHVHEGVKENQARKKPTVKKRDEADGKKEKEKEEAERADIVFDLPPLGDLQVQPNLGANAITKSRPRASRTRPSARPRRPTQNENEEKIDEGMDEFFGSTKVNREFVQLPDKPEEPPKFEEGGSKTPKKGNKFFSLKSKENKEETTPEKEVKEKSPAKAGGFSLGGLIGRKKSEPKPSAPASVKEVKKDEEEVEKPVEEEKEAEPEAEPEAVKTRKPAGVPKMALPGMGGMGMGLAGGGLLAEMAKKREEREKRASSAKAFDVKLENGGGSSSGGSSRETTPKPVPVLRPKEPAAGDPKPTPSPRPHSKRASQSPAEKRASSASVDKRGSQSPDVPDGKPAITREKPSLIPPKPAIRTRKPSPSKEPAEGERPLSMYAKPAESNLFAEMKLRNKNRNSREDLDKDDEKERVSSTDSLDSTDDKVSAEVTAEVKVAADPADVKVAAEVKVEKEETEEKKEEGEEKEEMEEKENDIENNNKPTEDKSKADEEKETENEEKPRTSKTSVNLDDLEDEVTAV